MNPFFSIIIPTYNRAAFLNQAIKSILYQSYNDWEVIIVDDGSTDDTKNTIEQYQDNRIKYIYQNNSERSAARNNGIIHAQGDYILFLDSDDYLFPNFLKDMALEIENNKGKKLLYFHDVVLEKNGYRTSYGEKLPNGNESIINYLFQRKSIVGVCQSVIPRVFLECNKFDLRFSLWEDTHLFFRLLVQFPYIQTMVKGYCVVSHEESTVVRGQRNVTMYDVNRYMAAVSDLEKNYWNLFSKFVSHRLFQNYRDAKLHMYLYQTRVNKQYKEMYTIANLLWNNKKSMYNAKTLLKLPLYQLLGK